MAITAGVGKDENVALFVILASSFIEVFPTDCFLCLCIFFKCCGDTTVVCILESCRFRGHSFFFITSEKFGSEGFFCFLDIVLWRHTIVVCMLPSFVAITISHNFSQV